MKRNLLKLQKRMYSVRTWFWKNAVQFRKEVISSPQNDKLVRLMTLSTDFTFSIHIKKVVEFHWRKKKVAICIISVSWEPRMSKSAIFVAKYSFQTCHHHPTKQSVSLIFWDSFVNSSHGNTGYLQEGDPRSAPKKCVSQVTDRRGPRRLTWCDTFLHQCD